MRTKLVLCVLVLIVMFQRSPNLVHSAATDTGLILEFTEQTFLFDKPDLGRTVIRVFPIGTRVLWGGVARRVSTVALAPGSESRSSMEFQAQYIWFQVQTTDTEGWIQRPQWKITNPYHTTLGLGTGKTGRVAYLSELHQAPEFHSKVLAEIIQGATFTVLEGPIVADLYSWWKVKITDQHQGWIADTLYGLEAENQPSSIASNYQLCAGSAKSIIPESFIQVLSTQLTSGEQVQCLGSANLAGNSFMLAAVQKKSTFSEIPVAKLRIFSQDKNQWTEIYNKEVDVSSSSGMLGVYDFMGNGKPILLWTSYAIGSGALMSVTILNYDSTVGIQEIFKEGGFYRGWVEPRVGGFLILSRNERDTSSNCCLDGLILRGYAWQTNRFVTVVANSIIDPTVTLIPQDIDIHPVK